SAEAVAKKFRSAKIICLPENEGMPGRNHGFRKARGRYVCLLDDDSYPTGRAIPMALAHLEKNPKTAAVVGRVVLPDGSCGAPADGGAADAGRGGAGNSLWLPRAGRGGIRVAKGARRSARGHCRFWEERLRHMAGLPGGGFGGGCPGG